MRNHLPLLAALVSLLSTTGVAHAELPRDDVAAAITQAMQWALDGGLTSAKKWPKKTPVYVVETNLPKGADFKLPDQEVKVVPYVRMQAFADIGGDRFAFMFDRVRQREQRVVLSLAFKPFSSVKNGKTPPPTEGAEIELEREGKKWKVAHVVQRWP